MTALPPELLLALPALFVSVVLLVGLVFVVRDTIRRRGNWGVNFRPAKCLQCGEPVPVVRLPANVRQAMWGGWTCPQCGFELDKWGRPVSDQPLPARWAIPTHQDVPPDDRYRPPSDPTYREERHD